MPSSIPNQALVVVADGGKATLFRCNVVGEKASLRKERDLTPHTLSEQGPSGSRPQEQSPKQTGEASFAHHLVGMLHSMHQQGEFQHLVLVADPTTLGQLSSGLNKTVEATVMRTLAKDLTNHPQKAIESALLD